MIAKPRCFLDKFPASVIPKETGVKQDEWNKMIKRQRGGMKQSPKKSGKKKKVNKVKRTVPQRLNKDPYVAGAIHTDPEVLPKSILKRHNERYPYNTTADTISDIC